MIDLKHTFDNGSELLNHTIMLSTIDNNYNRALDNNYNRALTLGRVRTFLTRIKKVKQLIETGDLRVRIK